MSDILIDSYQVANFDSNPVGPTALHPSADANGSAGGQSFQTPASPVYTITSVKFYLQKVGNPTGNGTFNLYAHSGTYGESSIPTGAKLATGTIDVSTISTTQTLYEVTFSTPYLSSASTSYVLTFEAPASGTFNGTNYINLGADGSSPSHGGIMCYYNNSAWHALTGYDTIFYVYGTSGSASASPSLSASLSPSPSPSVSVSLSGSLSPSVSISLSPSVSPSISISLSPSVSESASPSVSPSASPSISVSLSPSISISASPSLSVSLSPSASPSPGFENYSKGNYVALPDGILDLETAYSAQDYLDVDTKNNIRVGQVGTQQYMLHQFKDFVDNEPSCQLEWEGQTTFAPTMSTVYLQIFNRNTPAWETVATNNSSPADIDFTLIAQIPDLTNYKDASGVIVCRVYQLAM